MTDHDYQGVWVHTHANGTRHAVRFGGLTLAQFNSAEFAFAYRNWIWARRGWANPGNKYTTAALFEARIALRKGRTA